jgi:hypothetical protein
VFGLVAAAGLAWALATPLFTGPDEVSQARRAAAVARGQFTGRQDQPDPALLLTVEVPGLYGQPAEEQWLCHLGPLVTGAPQEAMALPTPPCPDLRAAPPGIVTAETVQYRGQPFFYALVGAPTLVDRGLTGAYAMRAVGVLLTAALVASAAATLAGTGRPALAGLGLLGCLTPGVVYLAGSTNPSAVEIAAALSAWAAVAAVAGTDPSRATGAGGAPVPAPGPVDLDRLVRRLGPALVVLTLCRGLGPAFAAAVVVVGALAAGWTRSRALLRRSDLRWWAGAVVAATVASGAWLAHIGRTFPLPDRPGSGWADAFGWLPWYLRQSVGVFGTNDSAVSPAATALWCLVVLAVTAVGVTTHLQARRPRTASLAVATLVGGLALNITAEGLASRPSASGRPLRLAPAGGRGGARHRHRARRGPRCPAGIAAVADGTRPLGAGRGGAHRGARTGVHHGGPPPRLPHRCGGLGLGGDLRRADHRPRRHPGSAPPVPTSAPTHVTRPHLTPGG